MMSMLNVAEFTYEYKVDLVQVRLVLMIWLQHCFAFCGSIIECLQKLKEKWESCQDPEQEIVQKFWRFVFSTCFTLCVSDGYSR